MSIDIQFKLKNNPAYLEYLHHNSNWYKILNRNPSSFKLFEEEVKEKLRLRPSDRIEKMLQTFEMIGTIVQTLK